MKHLNVMLKPASSACNLRCRYCFYADLAAARDCFSFGKMDMDTADRILRNLFSGLEPGDSVTLAFQGGEPTLVGLAWYEQFLSLVESVRGSRRVEYALQTNGTLLNEDWCRFLKAQGFLVGLSIDTMPRIHNDCRVDADGKGTYWRVMKSLRMLKKHEIQYNVLCTLTNQAAAHPREIWNWILENDLKFIQFTPCMDDLEGKGHGYALTPERFSYFYTQLFPLWFRDFRGGNYRSIKLFDDIVNLMAYGVPTACGMDGKCRPQIIVESDGSTYPCDFYCLDKYRLGSLKEEPLDQILKSPVIGEFLDRPREKKKLCGDCPYVKLCGGGCCQRMEQQVCCGPEDGFCGYRDFLNHTGAIFREIAVRQRAMRGL